MARYTDIEIIKSLECCANADCVNCPRWSSEEWYSGMCADFLPSVLDLINRLKSDIAREIYVALYNEIIDARASNFDVIKERETKHNVNRYEDGFCMYCDGKIHALEGILYFVEELIKKYTEGTNE